MAAAGPMLERTATSLEACKLYRALPSSTKALKSRRKLHTSFWSHGAAALELPSIWPAQLYDRLPLEGSSNPRQLSGLVASTFLLDFLYPAGAAALLRRVYGSLLDRQAPSRQVRRASPRSFTSSARSHAKGAPAAGRLNELGDGQESASVCDQADSPSTLSTDIQPKLSAESGTRRDVWQTLEDPSLHGIEPSIRNNCGLNSAEDKALRDKPPAPTSSRPEALSLPAWETHEGPQSGMLQELIAKGGPDRCYEDAWILYRRLDLDSRQQFIPDVIRYLSASTADIEARRICSLFAQLDPGSWDHDTLAIAVIAHIRLENVQRAINLFKRGLRYHGLVGGMDELLVYAFAKSGWEMANDIWTVSASTRKRLGLSTTALPKLRAVSDLGAVVLRFYDILSTRRLEQSETKLPLSDLLSELLVVALTRPCEPSEASRLLAKLGNPEWYHWYLLSALESGHTSALAGIYRTYRRLPGVRVTPRILHGIFDIFYPKDLDGIEQVYEDFQRSIGHLDRLAQEQFLRFYANRGDLKAVQRLGDSLISNYKHLRADKDPSLLDQFLMVYATRGDAEEVDRRFAEMEDRLGVLSLSTWNIRLRAYMVAKKYDQAIEVFEELRGAVTPSQVSYGMMMEMTAKRGELDLTLQLADEAKQQGLPFTPHMAGALVEAYCQQDRMRDAVRACHKISQEMKEYGSHELVHIWNKVLRRYAERRNLGSVYYVVNKMSHFNIPWNAGTYYSFLRGLLLCNRVHDAYNQLRLTHADRSRSLKTEHFALVMSGALRTGEWGIVVKLKRWMEELGLPMSFNALVHLTEAMIGMKSRPLDSGGLEGVAPLEGQNLGRAIVEYCNGMLRAAHQSVLTDEAPKQLMIRHRGDLNLFRSESGTLARAVRVLTKLRDFASTHELAATLSDIFRTGRDGQPGLHNLPVNVLSSLMDSAYHERDMERVMQLWEIIWDKALKDGRSARLKEGEVFASNRYDLMEALTVMLQVYNDKRDGQGMLDIVHKVTSAGFKLSGPSYNYMVQSLLALNRTAEAFEVCETMLMPNFAGWKSQRIRTRQRWNLPLADRRRGNNPRWLRPLSTTLIRLAGEYRRLRDTVMWSAASARMVQHIDLNCPRCVDAFLSLRYSGVGIEREVFAPAAGQRPLRRGSPVISSQLRTGWNR